jgi:predicted RNase H-like HicB family nuclease
MPLVGERMSRKPLFVRTEWDEEVSVWVATSDDVPGLTTEEDTLEGLVEKLKIMIPELLDANGIEQEYEVPFEVLTRRFEIAQGKGINV